MFNSKLKAHLFQLPLDIICSPVYMFSFLFPSSLSQGKFLTTEGLISCSPNVLPEPRNFYFCRCHLCLMMLNKTLIYDWLHEIILKHLIILNNEYKKTTLRFPFLWDGDELSNIRSVVCERNNRWLYCTSVTNRQNDGWSGKINIQPVLPSF